MSGGSQQLRIYRRARRDGATMATACVLSGISMAEARLHDASDAENPPPPEAYELLTPSDAHPARPAGTPAKETPMARADRDQEVQEVHAPDFQKMKSIFLNDIDPSVEKNAKSRGDLSAAWKAIEEDCHCNKRAAKLLHRLHGESEETRDDFLRTLYGGMQALGIGISQDLVDRMTGGEAPTMPVAPVGGAARESALLN